MALTNYENKFYGQQEDERILYLVKPHVISVYFKLGFIYLIALTVLVVFVVLGKILGFAGGALTLVGIIIAILMFIFGTKIVNDSYKRNLTYITDRRIVRFEPTTIFATNIRSLSWDEAVKVKTYPPNFLWKQLAIGTVEVHSRTTNDAAAPDDIKIEDVYYYRDLGNYIDKILFTYKQKPKDIAEIHPFIAKPAGQRY